jgi:pyruvate,water dikinase
MTWIEDPSQVMGMLQDYVARTDYDPVAEQVDLATAREGAIAEARERLASYPEQVAGQFEGLLKAAQDSTVISEDHAYWIDFRANYELRRVVVALGQKLAEVGVLENADDVVYFTLDELQAAARAPQDRELKALAAQRKADMARYATMTPPPAVGTMPPGPPPNNPMFRAVGKFFGTQPPPIEDPRLLKGVGGSRGTVTGKVKVMHSLNEAQRLQPGDILVVETTTPPWTPLFNTAAAVVTDTGGVLSHCAVVAREYGIPAVVGTGVATQLLKDGQVVEVDGTAGTVRVISD